LASSVGRKEGREGRNYQKGRNRLWKWAGKHAREDLIFLLSLPPSVGWPDMRLPILYSISWPHRIPMNYKPLDLVALGSLTFK